MRKYEVVDTVDETGINKLCVSVVVVCLNQITTGAR